MPKLLWGLTKGMANLCINRFVQQAILVMETDLDKSAMDVARLRTSEYFVRASIVFCSGVGLIQEQ